MPVIVLLCWSAAGFQFKAYRGIELRSMFLGNLALPEHPTNVSKPVIGPSFMCLRYCSVASIPPLVSPGFTLHSRYRMGRSLFNRTLVQVSMLCLLSGILF